MATALVMGPMASEGRCQLIISEVKLLPANPSASRWVEVHNLGSDAVDLSTWAIYHASKTPGRPGTSWWAFPEGATLGPGGYLRVHWYAEFQPHTQTDYYTGNHILDFLFSLGGEELNPDSGALALLSDRSGLGTTLVSSYEDWVSWGEDGFKREELAVSNGRWQPGQFVPPLSSPGSIALNLDQRLEDGFVPSASAFFHDASPTPLRSNHQDLQVSEPMGWSCAIGSPNPPKLELLSVPTAGNRDFGFRVRGSSGTASNQMVLIMVSSLPGDGLPIPGLIECPVWVDYQIPPKIFAMPSQGDGASYTDLPLPLTWVAGGFNVTAQAFLFNVPHSRFDYAASAALTISLGR
jgi:hypothetical protein